MTFKADPTISRADPDAAPTGVGTRVAVLFHRIGPYHLARLATASTRCALTAIELSSVDRTYAWSRVDGAPNFERFTVFCDEAVDRQSKGEIVQRVHAGLAAADPEVVAIAGWSEAGSLAALLWCVQQGRPAVLMSESGMHDELRRRAVEAAKRRVVGLFGSALVGGAPHAAYACALGVSAAAVFEGYDAVDNAHFERGARHARAAGERWRKRLGLPERFFLASSRFVPKKNLIRLLAAYSRYRQRTGAAAWHLVVLGDGELRAQVERRIGRADLAGNILLAGFRQYQELPAYYGLASAFVHASTSEQWGLVVNEAMAAGLPVIVSDRCGCVPDLVSNGVNGFTFDPYEVDELAGLMQRVAAMTNEQRLSMSRVGQRIVAAWGPERFADGLMKAVEAARSRPARNASWLDRQLVTLLIHRPGRWNSSP